MVVDPGFSIDAPKDDVWEVSRNRLWNGEPTVTFRHVERGAGALTFRVLKVPDNSRAVPLEVLAEGYFVTAGLASGVEAKLEYSTPLVVGDQPAVACLGKWTIRPLTQSVAQVMVRSPEGLVVVTLIAPPEHIETLSLELERALRHFRLETDVDIDPFLLDLIPFEDPQHDPGHFGP